MKPKVVVDLGVDYGLSSFTFAKAGAGHVYGIDSFEGDPEAGERDTESIVKARQADLGIQNMTLVRGYFSEVAKTWTLPIDILHIDGRHRYEDIKEDYEIWSRFVVAGGVILIHDTEVTREPYGVKRYFAEIQAPKTNFKHAFGLGVVSQDASIISKINRRWWLLLNHYDLWFLLFRLGRKSRKILGAYREPTF